MKIKTSELIGAVDLTDTVCKALRRSWQLGQTYWQQADSESFAQNKKAETTHAAFVALLDDTRAALAAAPAQPVAQQGMAYAALPDAPSSNLPSWGECQLRVTNSDFLDKRVARGGYGAEPDSKVATELHRFIYEYDDQDPYMSAWFRHRLEKLLNDRASRP